MTLLLILLGFILKNYGPWFEDQAALGGLILTIGIVMFVVEIIVWLVVLFGVNR